MEDLVSDPKDIEFLESMSLDETVDLLNNCDYLNIPSLVDLLSANIAMKFRGKGKLIIKSFLIF